MSTAPDTREAIDAASRSRGPFPIERIFFAELDWRGRRREEEREERPPNLADQEFEKDQGEGHSREGVRFLEGSGPDSKGHRSP